MSDQTRIGQELRSIMNGRAASAHDSMLQRCAEKLARWQKLARKYHGSGLSRGELDEFWHEIHDRRTNVELILQISVRRSDWAAASQEVKAFIDELTYEIMATDGAYHDLYHGEITGSGVADEQEENIDSSVENDLKKQYKKLLAQKYQLSERAKFTAELASLLAHAHLRQLDAESESQASVPVQEPAALLEYLAEYIQALEAETVEAAAPRSQWRLRFFGR